MEHKDTLLDVLFKDFEPETVIIDNMRKNKENLERLGVDQKVDDLFFGTLFVYCGSHRNYHEAGWCTVPIANKRPLNARNRLDAKTEVIRIFGEGVLRDA